MGKFANFVIKYRWMLISLILILTLLFAYSIKNLKINSDFVSYLPESDEAVKLSKYIGNKYGGNLTAIVAIESDDVFKYETLKAIYNLTEKLRYVDGVSYVMSLTNAIDIKGTDEGIEIGKLISEVPTDKQSLRELKKYVLSKDLYKNLVSKDGKVTLIMCRLSDGVDKVKVAREIKKVVDAENLKEKVYFGGLPFQMIDMNEMIIDDLKILTPLVGLVIVIILFLSFKNIRGVVIPFLAVALSVVWTFGTMAILKIPLTIISNTIPVILTAIGSAYGIHIVNKFREDIGILDVKERSKVALSEVGLAVFLAGITTMAGFMSFVFGSYLIMIKEFGIFTSVGVLYALVISLTLLPSILSFLKWEGKTDRVSKKKTNNEFQFKIVKAVSKARYVILILTFVFVLASVIGIFKINREVSILEYFKPQTNVRATEEMLKKNFGGSLPLYILVKGDIQSPEVLKEMKKVEEFLKAMPNVHNPQSIVDIIEEMNYVMGEGKKIPDTREKVSNLMFLVEGEEIFSQLVSPDKDEALIQAMVTYESSTKISKIVEQIEKYFNSANNKGFVEFKQTGMPLIYKHLDDAIIRSQIQSLIFSLIFVFAIMVVLLKSFWGGLIGIVPVSLTIVVIYGFMGYYGIPLDIATVLIAGVSLGMGIDYSIHFMNRLKVELKESDSFEMAISKVLGTTGIAILINVLSVALGFFVLVFASVIPLQRFGIMILLTMFLSGGATLILMPTIILIFKPKFLEKLKSEKIKREVFAEINQK